MAYACDQKCEIIFADIYCKQKDSALLLWNWMFANTVTMNDEQKTDSMVVKIDNFDEKNICM